MNGNNAMITNYGYKIIDENLYEEQRIKYGFQGIINIILKGKNIIDETEKNALVEIVGRIRSLKINIVKAYQNKIIDEHTYHEIIDRFDIIITKVEKIYCYVSLLKEKKNIEKNYDQVCSQIKFLAKSIGPNKELQKEKMTQLGLIDSYLKSERILNNFNLKFNNYEKSFEESLKYYDYFDYIQLIDNEIDSFKNFIDHSKIPESIQSLINSWYRRMDEVITEQGYIVGKRISAYEKKCQEFGLVYQNKDNIERVIDLLQLYNPRINFNYDMFNKIYCDNLANLVFPENVIYDKKNNMLLCQIDEEEVSYPIYPIYNAKTFIAELKKLNPNCNISLSNDYKSIYATTSVENLILPVGFYINKDGLDTWITNKMILNQECLKFAFQRKMLSKDVEKLQKIDSFDLDFEDNTKELNLFELVIALQKLNGLDKVNYIDNKIVTTIKDADAFILPKGFAFDDDLNIVSQSGNLKVAVKTTKDIESLKVEAKEKRKEKRELSMPKLAKKVLDNKAPEVNPNRKKVKNIETSKKKNKTSKKMLGILKIVSSFSGALITEGLNIVTYPLTIYTDKCKEFLDKAQDKFFKSMVKGMEEVFKLEKDIEEKVIEKPKKPESPKNLEKETVEKIKKAIEMYSLDDTILEYSEESRGR